MAYYNNKLPTLNDIVFVRINSFSDAGTYCSLIEYDNVEGFILNTELDRRVFNPKKQFEYGTIYPVLVLSVCTNNNKLAIDLSYKKIKKEIREKLLEKFGSVFNINKMVHEFAFLTQVPLDEVYDLTIRKFLKSDNTDDHNDQDEIGENIEEECLDQNLEDGYKLYSDILKNPMNFTKHISEKYPTESNQFTENVKMRIKKTNIVIQQVFILMVLEEDAVVKLKEFLVYENAKIKYLSSPKYQIIITGETNEECDDKINAFVEHMKNKLNGIKHVFKLDEKVEITKQEYFLKFINFEHYKAI